MAWKTVRFTREELYELVWASPVQQVAKKAGLSDVGLAKLCRRHQVPIPGRGYWAKRNSGHTVTRAPLPDAPPQLAVATVTRWEDELVPDMPADVLAQWERGRPEQGPEPFNSGRHRLRHPLALKTAQLLAGRGINERGITPFVPGGLDVRVSPAMRSKALWLLELVVERIEASGFEVRVERDPPRAVLRAFGESVGFGVGETSHRAPNLSEPERARYRKLFPWVKPERMMKPSGLLRLRQMWSSGYEVFGWEDSAKRPIEGRVEEFVLALLREAWSDAERHKAEAYRERVHELWARRRRSRGARLELLAKGAVDFEQHHRLAGFTNALEKFVGTHEVSVATARWVRWAALHVRHRSPESRFLRDIEKTLRVVASR